MNPRAPEWNLHLGRGICIRCHQELGDPGRYSAQQQLVFIRQLLDVQTNFRRNAIDRAVGRSESREVEVEGHFLLSTTVDDREGVTVSVYRPRGLQGQPERAPQTPRP